MRRNPITGGKHVAANLGQNGVAIVEQMRRAEQTADENHGGHGNDD